MYKWLIERTEKDGPVKLPEPPPVLGPIIFTGVDEETRVKVNAMLNEMAQEFIEEESKYYFGRFHRVRYYWRKVRIFFKRGYEKFYLT